jgi:hypothetical protein
MKRRYAMRQKPRAALMAFAALLVCLLAPEPAPGQAE